MLDMVYRFANWNFAFSGCNTEQDCVIFIDSGLDNNHELTGTWPFFLDIYFLY